MRSPRTTVKLFGVGLSAVVILLSSVNAASYQPGLSENTNDEDDAVIMTLRNVTIVVPDYDEALKYYTETLGFTKIRDQAIGPDERFVVVAPKGQRNLGIILYRPGGMNQDESTRQKYLRRVGGETLWVFETDDCRKTFQRLSARGVKFRKAPQQLPWGIQAVFEDLYGNEFVIIEYQKAPHQETEK